MTIFVSSIFFETPCMLTVFTISSLFEKSTLFPFSLSTQVFPFRYQQKPVRRKVWKTSARARASVCVCVCVCARARARVCVFAHAHQPVNTHTYKPTHTHADTHTNTRKYMHIHIHTHTYPCLCACVLACVRGGECLCACACVRAKFLKYILYLLLHGSFLIKRSSWRIHLYFVTTHVTKYGSCDKPKPCNLPLQLVNLWLTERRKVINCNQTEWEAEDHLTCTTKLTSVLMHHTV